MSNHYNAEDTLALSCLMKIKKMKINLILAQAGQERVN